MRVDLRWLVRWVLVGSFVATALPAAATGRGQYAVDKDQDDVDDDDAVAKKKKPQDAPRDTDRRRRRRDEDDSDLRDDDTRRKPRHRRDDDDSDLRDDDARRKPRHRRDDEVRDDDDRRDEDHRRPRRRRDDEDLRDEDDRRPRARDDRDDRDREDRGDRDDRDDRDDYPPRRRHRRTDRGPAFRWGVSAGPALGIAGSATGGPTALLGGFNLPIVRLGYQFPLFDSGVGLGLFAEPRIGLFLSKPFDTILTTIELAGTFALQVNFGKYFFFAAGLAVGGNIGVLQGDATRGPAAGGFLLRVGADLLLDRRGGRPSALSLAFEALPLFSHYSVGPVDGTTTFATIGLSVGYDSY